MKKERNFHINLKSNKGFTMQDLSIAFIFLMAFVGIISGLMYTTYQTNLTTKLTANATYYAMQILEDIDKISYEEVTDTLVSTYQSKVPEGYEVTLEITPYENEDYGQDLVKIVKLTISYTFSNNTEDLIIQRLKVKEI